MTRAELYALVWEQPILNVAQQLGLSRQELRNICGEYNIPLPAKGYWTKRTWNKAAERKPLPDVAPSILGRVNSALRRLGAVPIQVADAQLDAFNLNVPVAPGSAGRKLPGALHPRAASLVRLLQGLKPGPEGFIVSDDPRFPVVHIAPASISRTIELFDSLLVGLSDAGYGIAEHADGFRIVAEGEAFAAKFYETRGRRPAKTQPAALAAKKDRDRESNNPHAPSGKLCMEIFDARPMRWSDSNRVGLWYDHAGRPVGQCIRLALRAIASSAVLIKHVRTQLDEQTRVRNSQAVQDALQQLAERETSFLLGKADSYAQLQRLANLAELYNAEAASDANEPENLMARALQKLIVDMRRKFDRTTLRAELEKLGLFQSTPKA